MIRPNRPMGVIPMRPLSVLLAWSLLVLAAPASATPCTFVSDPQQLAFTDLKSFSVFLYKDVMDRKSLTSFVMRPPFTIAGKRIVRKKFEKIGIPDPAAVPLEYAIVEFRSVRLPVPCFHRPRLSQ